MMGPVVTDGIMQENQLSDEDYVIYRAKTSQKLDDSTAKAWMITAKTLFPRNFAVQLEAYTSQKAVRNPKEAARYFSSLFFDFPNEAGLWEEVQGITEALQPGNAAMSSQFHRDLFSHMLPEVQHQLLLAMADRTQDTLEHCRLMLILLSRLPQSIDTHGKKLIDTLLAAEKHSHYQTPVNCFRKLLVVDLLPTLLSSRTLDIPLKQLHGLILKSIEFYVCWLTCGSSTIQGLDISDLKPGEAWNNLFKLMYFISRKLGWELSSVFNNEGNRELMCQNLWAFYRSTPLGNEESPNFRQLLYCTTVLLVESLYEYFTRMDPCFQVPNQGNKGETMPLLLVRSFFCSSEISVESSSNQKHRKEEISPQIMLPVTVTRNCPAATATALLSSFLTAVSCWELLHQTEDLRNAFSRICVQLRTETWSWLPTFVTDGVLIYQGLYAEALNNLKSPSHKSMNPQSLLLKSAGIFLSLGNHVAAVEQVLHVMASLPEGDSGEPPAYPVSPVSNPHGKNPLHFMAMVRSEIVQYCVSILVACFRDRAFRSGNTDLAAGHLIVLLQYDWPINAGLLEEILEKIRRQGQFTYPLFVSYVIHVDILEEFAYLATDLSGAVNMDIFPPSAAQLATQRRMTTRRGDLGAREEFRMSMKRQMSRSLENIQSLITLFLIQERNCILQAVNN